MVNNSSETSGKTEKTHPLDKLLDVMDELYIRALGLAGYPREAVVEYMISLGLLQQQVENLQEKRKTELWAKLEQARKYQAIDEFFDGMGEP